MPNEIKLEKNVYQLLQEVRFELSKIEMKKSGHNAHLNFDYYELKDFVPHAVRLFNEKGLTPIFSIAVDTNGVEYAVLSIVKENETIQFKVPTANPSGTNPIQQLGAKITYLRRYLYLMALDIVENDIVDAEDPNEVKKKDIKRATPFQVEKIYANGKLIAEALKELGITNKNGIKELTLEKASELCGKIDEKANS